MAIIHDVIQGSPEWLALRLGIPTASAFHKVITAVKGDLSKSARKYAQALVAETLLGHSLESQPSTWAMQRGKDLEPLARAAYARENNVEVRQVGFVTTNDGHVGASPDGLIVGARRGVEIKCLLDDSHFAAFIDGPGDDFKQQVQGNLGVCELAEWDLYLWHPNPNLKPITIRTLRDEPYITKMGVALAEFLVMRNEMLATAKAAGWGAVPGYTPPATFGAMRIAA
jgi:hypothetical protein